jgi:glutathione synthase/RimK-type ligase-like ATP-grasp enzyme
VIRLADAANPSNGGRLDRFQTGGFATIKAWVAEMTRWFGLRVCGIDFFAPADLTDPDSFIVLEVNSNPSLTTLYEMGHSELGIAIWQRLFERAFDDLQRPRGRDRSS